MVHIHELTPGVEVHNLLVEMHSLDGSDGSVKPNDPIYRATVKDATGYASLVYQASPNCNPAAIKKGRNYTVSGKLVATRMAPLACNMLSHVLLTHMPPAVAKHAEPSIAAVR